MKLIKKIISILLCLILIAAIGVTALAATTPNISLSNVKAMPGDTVTIDISISNNPGIMAMSFCITYDSDAFEYTGYSKGYLSRYTIKDHADKCQVAFVNDEASDKSNDGVMLSIKFKIKDDAKPGKHTVTIANQNREKHGNKLHNSFSNSNLKYIVPTVNAGSITVGETCENAGHKYGEWNILTPADCKHTGTKEHTCVRCKYVESITIPITHDFEADWTVDKAATPTEDGIMSRHCKLCDAVTDKITFTYKEVEDSQKPDDNTSSDNSTSGDDSSNESNNSSSDTSSDIVSDENSSESNTSDNHSSENENSSDATVSNNSSTTPSPNKTPINNTVGSKNPQSAVENIKDYQDNIKPNLENNSTSSILENTDSQDETASNNSSTPANTNTDSSTSANADDDYTDTEKGGLFTTQKLIQFIGAILNAAAIVLGILLIIKRKKSE